MVVFCCCWFCLTDRSPASPDRGKSRKPSRSPECHAGVTARGAASQPASPSALRERDGDYRRAGVLRPPPPGPPPAHGDTSPLSAPPLAAAGDRHPRASPLPRRPRCRGPPGAAGRGKAAAAAAPRPGPAAGTERASARQRRAPCPAPDTGQSGAGGGEPAPPGAGGGSAEGPRAGAAAAEPAARRHGPRPSPLGRAPAAPRGRERSGLRSASDLRAPHGAHGRSRHRALAPAPAP